VVINVLNNLAVKDKMKYTKFEQIIGAIKELNYEGGWFYNIIYNIVKILFGSLSIVLSGSQY
jgi:hypothetical protein